jgi:O-antigen/teichoic acid export membrane protein
MTSSQGSKDRLFVTSDDLVNNVRGRTISSGAITLIAQTALFVMNLGSTMVLARLLLPKEFGLVAMVMTIVSFLRVFKEAGLSTATIQREGISHAQVSNLFWINVTLGALIAGVLALGAPVIAWFYGEPRLVGVSLALCATFVLAGATTQHMAILNRHMLFKRIALIQIGTMLCGILTAITMAWLGFGYWSLVGMHVTGGILECVLTWIVSPWRPQRLTRHSGTRPLLHFGANLTASSLVHSVCRGMDAILIGRFCGADALGLYSRAGVLLLRPLEQLVTPIHSVLVPALSRLQNQEERYHRTFLQAYESLTLASFVITGFFVAVARPTTLLVLGPNWEHASPIFASFTLAALYYPLSSACSWLFASQGRGHDWLVVTVLNSVVTVVAFVLGLAFGPAGVALAYSVSCVTVQLPIVYRLAGRCGPVRTAVLWTTFFKLIPVWGAIVGITLLTKNQVSHLAPLSQLLMCGLAGFCGGTVFILAYPPSRKVAVSILRAVQDLLDTRSRR